VLTPRVRFNTRILDGGKRAVRLRLRPALSELEKTRLKLTRFRNSDAVGVAHDAPELLQTGRQGTFFAHDAPELLQTGRQGTFFYCDFVRWELSLLPRSIDCLLAVNRGGLSLSDSFG
jgi:hypothetical protein